MAVTVRPDRRRPREGDCLAMALDCPTTFHSPTRAPARCALVLAADPVRR